MKRGQVAESKAFNGEIWETPEGKPLSCYEKLKVLNENIEEIHQACQDALEDAVLMGGAEAQLRRVLHDVVEALKNPYLKK